MGGLFHNLTKPGIENTDTGQSTFYDSPQEAFSNLRKQSPAPVAVMTGRVNDQIAEPDQTPDSTVQYDKPQMEGDHPLQFVHPSFKQASTDQTTGLPANNGLTKKGALIDVMLHGLQGAASGAGSPTFGEGFQRGTFLPFQTAEAKQELQKGAAQTELTRAQAKNYSTAVTLPNGMTVPFALAQKLYPAMLTANSRETIAGQNNDTKRTIAEGERAIQLRKQGLKLDANGNQVPIAYEDMSPVEQGVHDLTQARADAASAHAALDKAKNDPKSPAYQLAYSQLQAALRRTAVLEGNLGLRSNEFERDTYGTVGGTPIPGAPANPDNPAQPEGLKTAGITKPTTEMRNKGATAQSVIDTGNTILQQLKDPEIRKWVGTAASRAANFADFLGALPPQMAALKTNMGSLAAFTSGLHPVKGIGAIQHFDEVFNGPKGVRTPEALEASIGQMIDTANRIKARGTVKTVGAFDPSKASASATDAKGNKAYLYNNKWVDASGNPISTQ